MTSTITHTAASIEIEAQGRLLQVKAVSPAGGTGRPGGDRGAVHEFSDASRLRLLRMLARLRNPETPGYRSRTSFLTLTTKEIHHPKVFKVLAFRLFRILKRKAPTMAVIWRLEYQKRGAPHIHCILYNAPFIKKDWLQATWGEITGEHRPFTRIELVRAYRQLMSYASKYVAKREDAGGFNSVAYSDRTEGLTPDELKSAGRVWGIYNREALPYSDLEAVSLPMDGSYYLIKRYGQSFWPELEVDDYLGFTIFCDDPYSALEYMVKLSRAFASVQP